MSQVSIVGAGPGAKDLMTLRAINRLKSAEILVWTDSLIPSEILELTNENCERIRTSSLTLDEILKILIEKSKEGKKVVRLHDGDPCLFGAISEQICGLTDAGIKVEVVPGVSAYQATASTLGIELTIPEITQTIILSRAGGKTGKPEEESIEKLAKTKSSLCLYLSARHIEEVQSSLLEHYPEDTPVIIGYRVSWPEEWIKIVPLNDLAKASRAKGLIRTTLYIISPGLNIKNKRSKLYHPNHSHLFRSN